MHAETEEFFVGEAAADIREAWRRAAAKPGSGADFRVGVCDARRELLACAHLSGWNQVLYFACRMERLGYENRVGGPTQDMLGCDVLFVPRHEGPDLLDA